MIKKFLDRLQQRTTPDAIPVEAQNDPVGQAIEWTPLKPGGANFKTHRLVQLSPQQYVFKASLGALIFYAIFIVVGIGVSIGMTYGMWRSHEGDFSIMLLFPATFGISFAAVGGVMMALGTRPIQFDRQIGWFWVGRRKPTEVFNTSELKKAVRLEEIHALQLIREYVHGGRNSAGYYSYELNLVLKDHSRLNVIDHGKLATITSDAQTLATWLNCPLWRTF